jgi:hypothetical protein
MKVWILVTLLNGITSATGPYTQKDCSYLLLSDPNPRAVCVNRDFPNLVMRKIST